MGGAAWTPSALSGVLWMDASDCGYTNNQPVSVMVDKYGVSNMIDTGLDGIYHRPTCKTNQLNGLSAISFDGDASDYNHGDFLSTAKRFSTNVWTIFIVASGSAQTNNGVISQHNTMADSGRCAFIGTSASSPYDRAKVFINNGTSFNYECTNKAFNGIANIIASYASSNSYFMAVNGISESLTSGTAFIPLNCNLKIGAFGLDSFGTSASPYEGLIFEVLCYTNLLNASDRQKIEGYLAWKWGIQARLPASHPYKNARPTL